MESSLESVYLAKRHDKYIFTHLPKMGMDVTPKYKK